MDKENLTGMERYEYAESLLMEILECGAADVDAILQMMRTHEDAGELIEYTAEFIEDVGDGWNFPAFISGVEHLVLSALQDRVSDALHDALATVTIDDNYVAWGGVADSGDLKLEPAEVFAEMCKEGVTNERVDRLIETYESTIGIGGYDDTR